MLNIFFRSVFTIDDLNSLATLDIEFHGRPLYNIKFSVEMVRTKLRSLKPDKAPGPDGIHPYELANSLCHPLSILFTKSLEEMNAHYTWKEGHITPLRKKESKGEPGNYRPVSLTSLVAKCMEAFIREAVLELMMTNNLFSDDQHGFVASR